MPLKPKLRLITDKMGSTLEKIHQAALKFLAPLDLAETYKIVVDEAVKLVSGGYGSILLMQNGELVRVYSSAKELFNVESGTRGPLGSKDPRYEVVKKNTPIVLTLNQMKTLKKKFPGLRSFEDRAAIMIPLIYRNISIGMLSVIALKNDNFTEEQLEILKLFGSLASLGIRKTQLYNETKQALETRDLFISMASHELRTPLTALNGYAQLLYKRLSNQDTQESEWVEGLAAECVRMTLLVKDLLEINRIKSGDPNYFLKEFHLREIINRAINNFNFANPNRRIILKDNIKGSDLIIADFDKLLQVIINLLGNAFKFSSTDKPVNITLKSSSSNLSIIVKDQGKGIAKKDLDKIFNSYYRGSNTEREGMGLGLFIVNDIVNKLNGSIKVTSKENKGSTFEICLPKYSN